MAEYRETTGTSHGRATVVGVAGASVGAEAWQFFAFIFAAVVTLALALLDEVPHPGWRIVGKVVAFFAFAYFVLVNSTVRDWLLVLLRSFKEKHL